MLTRLNFFHQRGSLNNNCVANCSKAGIQMYSLFVDTELKGYAMSLRYLQNVVGAA